MAVVTLTFTGSEKEITSGVPESVSIVSNVPATIYFTIDGSIPSLSSPIYIDEIEFPTGYTSITLSAFGVNSDDEAGPILTQVFAADTTSITVTRHVGLEGVVIDRADEGPNYIDGFDADGEPNRFFDMEELELELVHAARGYLGIEEGTQIEVNFPLPTETVYPFDDSFVPFSTPEVAELFNPYARTIVIDNRIDNDLNIMLRPFGSLHNLQQEFGGKRLRGTSEAAYVSGGFVRRFYDAKNNVMVSYYFDHNEGRYVKNIQELPSNIPQTLGGGNFNMPLVFKWVTPGMQTGLVT
jgi:hypothetical protein